MAVAIGLSACGGGSGNSDQTDAQKPEQEESLTDTQKVAVDVCACMEEHAASQDMAKWMQCMMAIREKYPTIDAMNDEAAKAEIDKRCGDLVKKFKEKSGKQ